jgi:hypothetical protein
MFDNGGGKSKPGVVTVQTTSGRGLPIEHWADRCVDRIIFVGDKTHRVIRDQANAYKDDIHKILVHYMTQAIKSDRTTLYNLLLQQGHKDMAEILHKL